MSEFGPLSEAKRKSGFGAIRPKRKWASKKPILLVVDLETNEDLL